MQVLDEVGVNYSRVMCRLAWHHLFPKLNTDQVFIKQHSQIQTGMFNFQVNIFYFINKINNNRPT